MHACMHVCSKPASQPASKNPWESREEENTQHTLITPCVTKNVSSCISCQCAGGPAVFGGTVNSADPIRLSVLEPSSRMRQMRLLGRRRVSPDFAATKLMARRGIFILERAVRASSSMVYGCGCSERILLRRGGLIWAKEGGLSVCLSVCLSVWVLVI